MKYHIFAIYDLKAEAYHLPFFQHNHPMAVRMFIDATADPQSNLAKHPEDYALFDIGEFEDQNATFNTKTPAQVITGLEAIAANRKRQQQQLDLLGGNPDHAS